MTAKRHPKPAPKPTTPTSLRAAPMPDAADDPEAATSAEGDADALLARFEPEARAVDARDVVAYKGNAARAVVNVQAGVAAVMAEAARFREPGAPSFDAAAAEGTVAVAKALDFAARRVGQVAVPVATKRADLKRAASLRKVMATGARALATAGLLDAGEVKRMTAGRGPAHTARSCCDLAALFRRNAATIRGRHAVTDAQVDEAARLGSALVAQVIPRGAKVRAEAVPAVAEAAELRDRLAVVLGRRYLAVERAGGWLWGRAVVDHVPALHSFERGKSSKGAKRVAPKAAEGEEAPVDDVTPTDGW
ncbi:MAG: hypothetical protein U0324_07235 [Polyangiales bacterium]